MRQNWQAAPCVILHEPFEVTFDPFVTQKLLFCDDCGFFDLLSRKTVALSSVTQHAMPPKFGENGERSVLTLPLCLPCCVRDIT